MKKFSEWLNLRESDELNLDMDLDTDLEMDAPAPPPAQQAKPAPRPAQPPQAKPAPQERKQAPAPAEITLGGKGSPHKFLGGHKSVDDVKRALYSLFANYQAPGNDSLAGLAGLKNHPVKVRLSLDDESVTHDRSLDTLLMGGIKNFAHSFTSVKKFGDLDGKISVFPKEDGTISVQLKILNIDQKDKDLGPRVRLLNNYVQTQGQLKPQWQNVTVRVKI
jgi:hypothetical protein